MIQAQRGTQLRCRGWRQEALLRMLENNLENAENPDALIIYKSTAKAARDWPSYHRIVEQLKTLREDETLVMQSGKPIGRFRTPPDTPLVIMANGHVVGPWDSAEGAAQLEQRGLTISPGMTAAAWQYIGTQGILQGTYQTFMRSARQDFDAPNLAGRWIVTAGCGGMGGAQGLAGKMAGAATLVIEVDRRRVERRLETGYIDAVTESWQDAVRQCLQARDAGRPLSLALIANAAFVLPKIAQQTPIPDIVTDQTSTEPDRGYVPKGLSVDETERLRKSDREAVIRQAQTSIAEHVEAMLTLKLRGAQVFEYGNNLRLEADRAGVRDAFSIPGFVERYIRPQFFTGTGPFRWLSIVGSEEDIRTIDQIILTTFSPDHPIAQWIPKAQQHVQFQGLPARIGWLGHGERTRLALLVNDAIATGRISGPIAFTRDHLDAGSVAFPYRETENLKDGSDGIADWPILNALLNAISGADLVAVHSLADYGMSAGVTTIADGTSAAALRLERVLNADTGMGVHRYADAGYEAAIHTRRVQGLAIDKEQTDADTIDA